MPLSYSTIQSTILASWMAVSLVCSSSGKIYWASDGLVSTASSDASRLALFASHSLSSTKNSAPSQPEPEDANAFLRKTRTAWTSVGTSKLWSRRKAWIPYKAEVQLSLLGVKSRRSHRVSSLTISSLTTGTSSDKLRKSDEEPYAALAAVRTSSRVFRGWDLNFRGTDLTKRFTWSSLKILFLDSISPVGTSHTLPLGDVYGHHPPHAPPSQLTSMIGW